MGKPLRRRQQILLFLHTGGVLAMWFD
jgi:hypothetical protein